MDFDKILEVFEDPNNTGVLVFVLGFLFTLTIYHLLLYFQNKDKVYLYYTLYTGTIFTGYLNLVPDESFIKIFVSPIVPFLDNYEVFFKWLYNCIYFIFAFTFVNTKKLSIKWYKIIMYPIYSLLAIGILLQITSVFTENYSIIHEWFFLFFTPIIFIPTVVGYYILFTKIKSVVRYYIIIGSFFLFVTSILGALIYYLDWLPKDNRLRDSIFYLGLIVENICFSLGLGHKQKLIYEERALQKEKNIQIILDAQENERGRIARELHDGVVQQIGSVILKSRNILAKLNLLQAKESQELLESLEKSNQDLRTISHQMMPRALKELGVVAAVEDLLENSLGYTNIEYSFEHINIEERLPEKIEITIYRIIQELLNNIIKHSNASNVSVQLFKMQTNIVLIVEDNGVGFTDKKNNKGIGLLNISSRLNMVNGDVNFEPSPKSGTLVTIKIPVV